MSRGQASLEIMFAFMILLAISILLLNAMPRSELKQRNENLKLFQKNETARSAFTLGYLVGDAVKFENEIECGDSIKDLKVFDEKIGVTCSYSTASRWFLK